MQVQDDLEKGVSGAVPVPPDDAGKEEVIAALVANVEAMIKADRKITALKQLQVRKTQFKKRPYSHSASSFFMDISDLFVMQGHIWRTGFENNELEGVVFEDVPEALARWHGSDIKVVSALLYSLFFFIVASIFTVQ